MLMIEAVKVLSEQHLAFTAQAEILFRMMSFRGDFVGIGGSW